jgi:hypothetical protein
VVYRQSFYGYLFCESSTFLRVGELDFTLQTSFTVPVFAHKNTFAAPVYPRSTRDALKPGVCVVNTSVHHKKERRWQRHVQCCKRPPESGNQRKMSPWKYWTTSTEQCSPVTRRNCHHENTEQSALNNSPDSA